MKNSSQAQSVNAEKFPLLPGFGDRLPASPVGEVGNSKAIGLDPQLSSTRLSVRDVRRYGLYQAAVQCVEADVAFLAKTYRSLRGRPAAILGEDFCGTFALSCEWVRAKAGRTAVGIDLDPNPVAYGKQFNVEELNEEQRTRLSIHLSNVLAPGLPKADLICATNFSYFIFKERATLRTYFETVRNRLLKEGIFIVDAFGGAKTQVKYRERRKVTGCSYVWEQTHFDPISNNARFSIHFEGAKIGAIRNAFSYDWRMWSLPEIREVMLEAGFSDTAVYWEGTDSDGSGDGVFSRTEKGEECEVWIAYVVGIV